MRRSLILIGAFGTSGAALNLSTATLIPFWSCWEGKMESVSTGAGTVSKVSLPEKMITGGPVNCWSRVTI